jgi:hypothetical protein
MQVVERKELLSLSCHILPDASNVTIAYIVALAHLRRPISYINSCEITIGWGHGRCPGIMIKLL